MTKEEIVLTRLEAGEGMMLTNGEAYGREVYLGVWDAPERWREIALAEYEAVTRAAEAAEYINTTDRL